MGGDFLEQFEVMRDGLEYNKRPTLDHKSSLA